jgi:hypothetical protein
MAKKPEPPKPTTWNIYKFASKAVWLGTVEAPDEATAMEKAAAEFQGACQQIDGAEAMTAAKAKSPAPTFSETGRTTLRCRPKTWASRTVR